MHRSVVLALVFVALLLAVSGCSSGDEAASTEVDPGAVPDEVASLIDEWKQATSRGDGSIVDLYTSSGYHLYGTSKFAGDDIASHLENPSWTHQELTELLLLVEGSSRWVVTQGMRNTLASVDVESALTFDVRETPDGLKIAQSTWLKVATT